MLSKSCRYQKEREEFIHYSLTCLNTILLHFVPVVHGSKEAVPSWDPGGADFKAIQSTSVVPFVPCPYSTTHAVNSLAVTSSTQIAAPFRGDELFTVWPTEARTLTCCPPWKGYRKVIFLQANSPGVMVVILSFPALKLSASNKEKSSYSLICANSSIQYHKMYKSATYLQIWKWNLLKRYFVLDPFPLYRSSHAFLEVCISWQKTETSVITLSSV